MGKPVKSYTVDGGDMEFQLDFTHYSKNTDSLEPVHYQNNCMTSVITSSEGRGVLYRLLGEGHVLGYFQKNGGIQGMAELSWQRPRILVVVCSMMARVRRGEYLTPKAASGVSKIQRRNPLPFCQDFSNVCSCQSQSTQSILAPKSLTGFVVSMFPVTLELTL